MGGTKEDVQKELQSSVLKLGRELKRVVLQLPRLQEVLELPMMLKRYVFQLTWSRQLN